VNSHGDLTRDEMEARRLDAAKLFYLGLIPARVAETFDVSRTTASRWGQAFHESGPCGLKKSVASGRPSKLSDEQRAALKQLCERGPQAAGYARDRWTTELLARVILKQFRVRYDSDHVGRMLRRMGVEWKPANLWLRQKARQTSVS
jgi:putative transposase